MNLFSRLRPTPVAPVASHATQDELTVPRANSTAGVDNEKGSFPTQTAAPQDRSSDIDSDSDDELVHKNAQWGVQKAEAMCQAWGKKSLYATYAL